jgi:hypothetical protein
MPGPVLSVQTANKTGATARAASRGVTREVIRSVRGAVRVSIRILLTGAGTRWLRSCPHRPRHRREAHVMSVSGREPANG